MFQAEDASICQSREKERGSGVGREREHSV